MEWIPRALLFAAFGAIISGVVALAQDRSQKDGIYRADQAQRGATLYESYCANCHGADLSGGDLAPAIVGADFDENWNGQPLGQLFERIKTTMPQDNPDSLSRAQNADILAFILQKSGAPAGPAELPAQSETLNTIKFSISKP